VDALLVGTRAGITVALGTVLWYLLVQPDLLLSAIDLGGAEDDWIGAGSGTLRVLQIATAAVVFLMGFLTGLAVAFLAITM
jgi:hypothetical protein